MSSIADRSLPSVLKYAVNMLGCNELADYDALTCCLELGSSSVANARVCPSGPKTKQGAGGGWG